MFVSIRQICLILPLIALAVPGQSTVITRAILWQVGGYALPDLDVLHLSMTELHQPAQSRLNPALISNAPGWGVGLAHQFQTGEARMTSREAIPRGDPWLPKSAALRGWLGPVALTLGWDQRYNSHEQTRVPTLADSVGAWRDWDSRLEQWRAQAAWEALSPCCNGVGLRLGAGLVRSSLRVDQVEVQRSLGAWSWQAGARLQWSRAFAALGWEGQVTYNHSAEVHFLRYGATMDTVQVWGRLPQAFHTQFGYMPAPDWKAELALRYSRWSETLLGYSWDSQLNEWREERLRDRMEAAVTLHYGRPGMVNWHAGLSSSGSDPVSGSWLDRQFGGEQSTFFLMAGVSLPLGATEVVLKVADSHLGPGAYRKQTIVQVGLSGALWKP